MTIHDEKHLEEILSSTTNEEALGILERWMDGADWGSEVEACRLIQFIKIWDKLLNVKMKSRDERTAMIKAGITYRIFAHFAGLERKGATFKVHSIELLSYGLYGPDGMPRDQVTSERLNDQIVRDSLSLSNSRKVESIRKTAERLSVDRTTIRADRCKEQYSQGINATVQVLSKINKKHGF